jgi:hypothetical protein
MTAGITLAAGDVIEHAQFGQGIVTDTRGNGDAAKATVDFGGRVRELLPRWAPITVLGATEADDVVMGHADRYDDLYLPRSALANLPRGEPLIDGVLDRHTIFVIAGRDQTYKSFLAIDWLACMATGKAWMGHETERTKSLLVLGEGAWGLDSRFSAWEYAWGEKIEDDWLHVRRAPVNLFKQAAAFADLLARIREERYGVVVFDTLQRNAAGADQNSARDAGTIIESLDAVRQTTGGAAGFVAHTDKGDNDTRGSSAFEDDADIVWRTKRDEDEQTITVKLAKRKDGPDGLTFELRPKPVEGTGSLILHDARGFAPALDKTPTLALPVLRILGSRAAPVKGLSATPLMQALELSSRSQLYKALEWLLDKEWIDKIEVGQYPTYLITDEGKATLRTARQEGDVTAS